MYDPNASLATDRHAASGTTYQVTSINEDIIEGLTNRIRLMEIEIRDLRERVASMAETIDYLSHCARPNGHC